MTPGTNVLVPKSALEALELIRIERGYRSRNQTVRALLKEYVLDQQDRDPQQRLMHVATLMRYPSPHRAERTSRQGTGVPLRIPVDRPAWDTLRALAFRLPGQTIGRGITTTRLAREPTRS
ncbi:ribbon-helix-helix protein, CopG family [Nocardia noduli]|uniref:ribbon-helix-helix protein, CopG family n=1 Tax=Nocardia noduli TaxID=2815722 RepID=UPI001C2398EC|nr:ribbon-helix-helix protein, CopG family [Nocardia noduli]